MSEKDTKRGCACLRQRVCTTIFVSLIPLELPPETPEFV